MVRVACGFRVSSVLDGLLGAIGLGRSMHNPTGVRDRPSPYPRSSRLARCAWISGSEVGEPAYALVPIRARVAYAAANRPRPVFEDRASSIRRWFGSRVQIRLRRVDPLVFRVVPGLVSTASICSGLGQRADRADCWPTTKYGLTRSRHGWILRFCGFHPVVEGRCSVGGVVVLLGCWRSRWLWLWASRSWGARLPRRCRGRCV